MHKNIKITKKMKVFPKGQVIIPVDLRRRYDIDIGDQIEFITVQDGILLRPSKNKTTDRSLTDELYGMLSSYAGERKVPDKEAIKKATENGFTDGWT